MFADVSRDESTLQFKKVKFTKINPGYPVRLRILDKNAVRVAKHYLPSHNISFVCPGDYVCPVCANNRQLLNENPGAMPSNIRGFVNRQVRYLVNVYNRTLAKVTPSGNIIYAGPGNQFPQIDPESGELLTSIVATPLNRVEVLERGVTLFSQLNTINDSNLDEAGNPVGLWNYDIILNASGKGRQMQLTITPTLNNDKLELPEDQLYDLTSVSLRLTPEEIQAVLSGVGIKDILSSRMSEKASPVSESVVENSDVDSLFNA